MDLLEKKFHVPLVDRTPLEPPPIVVAVVGPPKVSFLRVREQHAGSHNSSMQSVGLQSF